MSNDNKLEFYQMKLVKVTELKERRESQLKEAISENNREDIAKYEKAVKDCGANIRRYEELIAELSQDEQIDTSSQEEANQ